MYGGVFGPLERIGMLKGVKKERFLSSGGEVKLVDRAYELIKRQIAQNQLAPNTIVSELSLSQALGIGRTPVREALQRLAAQGLITIFPRRGAVVSALSREVCVEAADLRVEVDRSVACLAALRATFEQRRLFKQLADELRKGKSSEFKLRSAVSDQINEIALLACANAHLKRAALPMHALGIRTLNILPSSHTRLCSLAANLCGAIADGTGHVAGELASDFATELKMRASELPLEGETAGAGRSRSFNDDAENQSSTDRAYLLIEEKIISGEFLPGSWMSQVQLADLLGMGLTTVREASLRLAANHLIEISPKRGMCVTQVDFSERFSLIEARRALERAISRRAASRVTPDSAEELRRLAQLWIGSAQRKDNASVQRADQAAKRTLLIIAGSALLERAITPIYALSRRLYFHVLRQPDLDIARGYSIWLEAIAAGDGDQACRISGHIAAQAEHLLNQSRN
jgi:DNA-binding GntR family transcriptional regulator